MQLQPYGGEGEGRTVADAVFVVAYKWIANVRHVRAYLVRAARDKLYFKQGLRVVRLQHAAAGYYLLGIGAGAVVYAHARRIRILNKVCAQLLLLERNAPVNRAAVELFYAAAFYCRVQLRLRLSVAGEKHKPARCNVQPMHRVYPPAERRLKPRL